MNSGGIEDDPDIAQALDWLASATGDRESFWARLNQSQIAYRNETSKPENFGKDLQLDTLGTDIPSAFLAQSKSLLDDRRSFDPALASQTIPWIKQIGKNLTVLDRVPGANGRAARMLRSLTVHPGSAIFELVMAGNYAADGFEVAFVEEAKGEAKTPDLRLSVPDMPAIYVECKRLQRGAYETAEQERHRLLFNKVAALIYDGHLSVHIDVTYTQELANVPESYLLDRLLQARSSPIVTLGSYPWCDKFGFGDIRPTDMAAVREDIVDSSLYFGTKLGRLLSGKPVKETGYHLAAGADPDPRDPRYIDKIRYGSIVTWQCDAQAAIEKKARYVKAKLVEADKQFHAHGPGIAHLAMDAELQWQASDLRRERNIDSTRHFRSDAGLMAVYLHYLVPRISETTSWMIDETIDRFGVGDEPVPTSRIFPGSTLADNDLPAWKLDVPLSR